MKKQTCKSIYILFYVIIFCLSICCNGCSGGGSWYGFVSEYFFRTNATLRLYADTKEKADQAIALTQTIRETLYEMERSISISEENSDVNVFNSADAGEKIEVNRITYSLFQEALRLYHFTDGYYNPAVYYSVEQYGFYLDDPEPAILPNAETIAQFQRLSEHFPETELVQEGDRYFVIKPQNGVITINEEIISMKVDFGGVGKGFAADIVSDFMDKADFRYAYFNFSASSMALKCYSSQRESYQVSIADPRGNGAYLAMNMKQTTLSTSADNGLYYERDGVRYCQIINPKTGIPVNVTSDGKQTSGVVSATVSGKSALEDDALTTSLMAMGKERAIAFVQNQLNNYCVFIVNRTDDNEIEVITNAKEGEFSLLNNNYQIRYI